MACLGLLAAPSTQAESIGQLRLGVGLKYRLADQLKLSGGTELRLVSDPAGFDSVLPNVRLKYQLLVPLSLTVGYRFKYQSDGEEAYETRHRFSFDIAGKYQVKALKLNLRLRVQDQMRETSKGKTRHKPTFRTRVGAKWAAWESLTPWVSAEHSLALNETSGEATRKWRSSLGLNWKLRTYQFGVFYRFDLQVADKDDLNTHILGLKLAFDPWKD